MSILIQKDSLIEKELAKAKNIIGARKVTCLAVGKMDSASCEKIVKSVLGNVVADCTASSGEEKNCLEYGLILKTEDGKLTCRLTLEEIINNLLARKREELALALFDGRLPEKKKKKSSESQDLLFMLKVWRNAVFTMLLMLDQIALLVKSSVRTKVLLQFRFTRKILE